MNGEYTGYVNGTKIIRSFIGNTSKDFDNFKRTKTQKEFTKLVSEKINKQSIIDGH
jgi:hypothetical protein